MGEAEAVLNLFHSCWFELNVLKKISTPSPTATISSENQDNLKKEEQESSEEPKLARIQTSHNRSMSDQSMTSSFKLDSDDLSPDSVLVPNSKLQTILSGKEVTDSEAEDPPQHHHEVLLPEKSIKNRGTRRKRRESKSLSDLEFEELKGFMDLGFVFSEEDKDSTLASIIPGLHRLGKNNDEKEEKEDFDESMVQRPYLSEAWEVYDRMRKRENLLMNWKVPDLNSGIDIKDSLRLWAHTVASTVR